MWSSNGVEHVAEQESQMGRVPVRRILKVDEVNQALDDGLGRGRSNLLGEIV